MRFAESMIAEIVAVLRSLPPAAVRRVLVYARRQRDKFLDDFN